MMTTVRPAGSFYTLEESMDLCREVVDKSALIYLLHEEFPFWRPDEDNVTCELHGFDERTGWLTWLICVGGNAALFADGKIE